MSGANSERKMSSSNTMMKRNDRHWTWLPVLFDCAWLATLVAIGPATWNEMPELAESIGLGSGRLKLVDDRLLRRDVALAGVGRDEDPDGLAVGGYAHHLGVGHSRHGGLSLVTLAM